ncbi:MAG: chorismate-binding protein, partial [Candidatus Margulisiibacteriota bacterium]
SYPSEVLINSSLESLYKSIFLPQAPKHGAFIHTDFCTIASCSPEEFFYYKDGKIRTRPIKGTIGRHQDRIKDHKAYKQLKNSDKDLAELIMITDLMRNDLSMCAEQNSVQTTTLCEIIPFHYVYHLMSTIEAKTKPSLTPLDILTTLSPGGSITGCPKYAACELIAELEPYPRNFYTGHIGFINGLNEASFNVAIRTCYQYNANPIMTHSGCGITVDSHSDQEYQESLDKLRFITDYALDDVTTSLN